MLKNKNSSFKSWLLTRPALFAIISFAAMTIGSFLSSLITGGQSVTITSTVTIITFLCSVVWFVRTLPAGNLDRRSFVAINNAQTIITSVVFVASMLYIMTNAQKLMARLFWMETHSTTSFVILLTVLALFYMYLCGIYIANLYAKYRRVRAMGVSMWKTLATAPFGFCMLWIPGYLMEDKSETSGKKDTQRGWYMRLTDWIIASPTRSATTLVILIMLSGFTFGYIAILVPLALAIVFAVWSAIIGTEKVRNQFSGIYSTTAIIINVVMIVTVLGYFAIAKSHNNATQMSPEIIEYIDTVQEQ